MILLPILTMLATVVCVMWTLWVSASAFFSKRGDPFSARSLSAAAVVSGAGWLIALAKLALRYYGGWSVPADWGPWPPPTEHGSNAIQRFFEVVALQLATFGLLLGISSFITFPLACAALVWHRFWRVLIHSSALFLIGLSLMVVPGLRDWSGSLYNWWLD